MGEADERCVLVYCRGCHKTHAAGLDERECYPGAWRDDETGARWEDVVAQAKGQPTIESTEERTERQMRAAAPDLYRTAQSARSLLRRLLGTVVELDSGGRVDEHGVWRPSDPTMATTFSEVRDWMKACDAALAKAEGRTP